MSWGDAYQFASNIVDWNGCHVRLSTSSKLPEFSTFTLSIYI